MVAALLRRRGLQWQRGYACELLVVCADSKTRVSAMAGGLCNALAATCKRSQARSSSCSQAWAQIASGGRHAQGQGGQMDAAAEGNTAQREGAMLVGRKRWQNDKASRR